MRIRYLVSNAGARGGATRTTLSMASELADRGHDVEVASLASARRRPFFPVSPHLRVVHLSGFRPRRDAPGGVGNGARWALRVALRRTSSTEAHPKDSFGPQMTRFHDHALRWWLHGQQDCVVVSTRLSLNLALARHHTDRQVAVGQEHYHLSKSEEVRDSYRDLLPRLDALAVLTEQDATAYRKLLGARPQVLAVPNAIPHGVELRSAPLDEPVVVAAGSLIRRKGFDLLIDAWALLASRHPGWRVRIYGVGAEREALEAQVRSRRLEDVVSLEGFHPDLPGRLDRASLFVLSSRGEGMPMVMLEAMAAGLPVVAFDCPTGPAELLEGGRAGLLVPRGDVKALAAAIEQVIGDEALRRRLGQASLQRAQDFTLPVTAARWEKLFASLGDARGLSLGR